jgi:DedD protein
MMERRAKERLIGASILVVLIVLIVPELLSGPKPAAPVAEPQRLPAAAASTPEPTRTVTVDLATSKAPAQNDTEADSAAPPPPPPPPPTAAASQGATTPAASVPAASNAPSQPSEAQPLRPAQPPVPAWGNTAPANAAAPPPAVQSPQHTPAGRGPPPAVESAAPPPISKAGSGHSEASHGSGWSVQLGSFASRANADNLVRQLKGQGFAVYVLSGGSGAATRHRVRVGPLPDRDAAERTAAKLKTLGHASSLMSPGA